MDATKPHAVGLNPHTAEFKPSGRTEQEIDAELGVAANSINHNHDEPPTDTITPGLPPTAQTTQHTAPPTATTPSYDTGMPPTAQDMLPPTTKGKSPATFGKGGKSAKGKGTPTTAIFQRGAARPQPDRRQRPPTTVSLEERYEGPAGSFKEEMQEEEAPRYYERSGMTYYEEGAMYAGRDESPVESGFDHSDSYGVEYAQEGGAVLQQQYSTEHDNYYQDYDNTSHNQQSPYTECTMDGSHYDTQRTASYDYSATQCSEASPLVQNEPTNGTFEQEVECEVRDNSNTMQHQTVEFAQPEEPEGSPDSVYPQNTESDHMASSQWTHDPYAMPEEPAVVPQVQVQVQQVQQVQDTQQQYPQAQQYNQLQYQDEAYVEHPQEVVEVDAHSPAETYQGTYQEHQVEYAAHGAVYETYPQEDYQQQQVVQVQVAPAPVQVAPVQQQFQLHEMHPPIPQVHYYPRRVQEAGEWDQHRMDPAIVPAVMCAAVAIMSLSCVTFKQTAADKLRESLKAKAATAAAPTTITAKVTTPEKSSVPTKVDKIDKVVVEVAERAPTPPEEPKEKLPEKKPVEVKPKVDVKTEEEQKPKNEKKADTPKSKEKQKQKAGSKWIVAGKPQKTQKVDKIEKPARKGKAKQPASVFAALNAESDESSSESEEVPQLTAPTPETHTTRKDKPDDDTPEAASDEEDALLQKLSTVVFNNGNTKGSTTETDNGGNLRNMIAKIRRSKEEETRVMREHNMYIAKQQRMERVEAASRELTRGAAAITDWFADSLSDVLQGCAPFFVKGETTSATTSSSAPPSAKELDLAKNLLQKSLHTLSENRVIRPVDLCAARLTLCKAALLKGSRVQTFNDQLIRTAEMECDACLATAERYGLSHMIVGSLLARAACTELVWAVSGAPLLRVHIDELVESALDAALRFSSTGVDCVLNGRDVGGKVPQGTTDAASKYPLLERCLPAVKACIAAGSGACASLEAVVRKCAVILPSYASLVTSGVSSGADEGSSLAASAEEDAVDGEGEGEGEGESGDEVVGANSVAVSTKLQTKAHLALQYPAHHREVGTRL